ncbi:oligosaccharide flippase family protein [Aminirod propionatiphilus]|uniref:Oligosaccharide flippase family protein n=1 Tax=Aminirod propionatiphilus TaxID=3415223 RepID=A0ACD1DU27_9BACT|nr:oligosaccharide flippase family protein [Synergistota bacterium]
MTGLAARLKNTFTKSRFANPESAARHVSLIAGGTIIAQAIGILTIPIVSRIYSPDDFGIMAVYASVIAILGELSGFRYYLAIPLPKDERYAKALVVLSLGLQITFVTLLALLLFVAGKFLLTKLSMPNLIPYRALIPLGLLAMGTYIVLTQWAIREKLFSTIARTKITQSLSGAVAKITLGLLGIRPLGLLIGTIVAQAGGITTLLRSLLEKKGVPHLEREDLRRVALRYRKFPMYDTFSGVLITTGLRIASLVFVALYSTRIVGLFSMAQQLLGLPSMFVGQAIGQVFIQRGSVAKRNGTLPFIFTQTYRSLMRIGFFPIMMISLLAPSLFSLLLGEQWAQAGDFARIISPWVAISFVYSPISNLFSILERQNIGLLLETIHLPLRILALYLGSRFGTETESLLFLTLTNCAVYLLKMSYLNFILGNSSQFLLKNLLIESLWTAILLAPLLFSISLGLGLIFFIVSLCFSLAFYGVLVILFFNKN